MKTLVNKIISKIYSKTNRNKAKMFMESYYKDKYEINSNKDFKTNENWVIISGSTGGIGVEICKYFDQLGYESLKQSL